MPWTAASRRAASSAAARALLASPRSSDAQLAIEAGVAASTISATRAKLTSVGVIEHVPVSARTQRPRTRQDSPTARAIAAGMTTPREVADYAHVSVQAAHKALSKTRPRYADVAAATDELTVQVSYDSPGTSATEQLLLSPRRSNRAIAEAAGVNEITVRRARARLERAGEILAYVVEEREPVGPSGPKPGTRREPPRIRELPRPPDFSRSICARVPRSQQGWWTSSDPVLREAAAELCLGCPVLLPCAEYAEHLPVSDSAIWAGMSQQERLRRKHQMHAAARAKPEPRNLRLP